MIPAILGYLCGRRAKVNPRVFWRYLIIGVLATAPLAIGGFTWYDEVFAGFFLLAHIPFRTSGGSRLSTVVFVVLIFYMIIQSLRGMVNALDYGESIDALRKIRWPLFFMLYGGLFFLSLRRQVLAVVDKDLLSKIVVLSVVFHLIYLVWGGVAIAVTGSMVYTQHAMINYAHLHGYMPSVFLAIWTPTAYVSSVLPITATAAFMLISNPQKASRALAWRSLFLSALVVFLFDSRSGTLCLFGLGLVAGFKLGAKRLLAAGGLIALFLASASLLHTLGAEKDLDYFFRDILRTVGVNSDPYSSSQHDVHRKVWMLSAVPALMNSTENFLFGYGYRMSSLVVAPYVYDLFLDAGVKSEYQERVSTEGITNLAVDTGVVGLTLFFAVVVLNVIALYKQQSKQKWLLLLALVFSVMWLFIINIIDSLILFLTIMPYGILVHMGAVVKDEK